MKSAAFRAAKGQDWNFGHVWSGSIDVCYGPDMPSGVAMRRLSMARPVRCLAVFGWCLIASGVPLPAIRPGDERAPTKDRSRPFPCMDSPCGCGTAEQCFSSCCCHSPAERLAWARAHGGDVEVLLALERLVMGTPDPALPPANRSPASRSAVASPVHGGLAASEAGSCCASVRESCCESVRSVAGAPSSGRCAAGQDRSAATVAGQHQPDAVGIAELPPGATAARVPDSRQADRGARGPAGAGRGIVLRAMLACQGVVPGLGAGPVALPPPVVEWCVEKMALESLAMTDDVAAGHAARPEPPPPRRAAA